MTVPGPTIAELKARVHKDRHREIGNWLARKVARPSAVYGCWIAVRLGLTAHHVTLAALFCWLMAAAAIGTGDQLFFVAGVTLAQLGYWLDHVDGQVARWRGTASLDGVYLDYLMHHAANLTLGFALGCGLAVRLAEPRWSIAGFAIGLGWAGPQLAQRLPLQGVFPAIEEHAWKLSGRRRGRRPSAEAPSLASERPRRIDVARVQGVRNPRHHRGPRRAGTALNRQPVGLALPLAKPR